MKDYKNLKSGTDVRGVASDVLGKSVTLTTDAVRDITGGFVTWLEKKTGKTADELTVAVGHDSRITADLISTNVIDVLSKMGVKVYDCGLSSTPAMFMTTVKTDADGSVQITASHHPADRNGLKFFTRDGGLDSPDISNIIEIANQFTLDGDKNGSVKKLDFMSDYAKILREIICSALGKTEADKPLSQFHIVVDAGNGAGGFYASDVLQKLGANTDGSVYLEPDGMFPNHIPNPEDKDAMASIQKAVLSSGADLGVIFDTDVDRAGCVAADGNEINRNRLIALSAAIVMDDNPNATIVTDSVTSSGLKEFIEGNLGGKHHRFKRGYKNVINEAVRLCNEGINSPLAIETSGHAALKENYFLDDGAYLMTKIIIKMAKLADEGKTIDDLIADLKMPVEADELRLAINTDDFKTYGNEVIVKFEKFLMENGFAIADDNREGIRASKNDGWVLLRLSVHDPIMPMNLESDNVGGVTEMLKTIKPFLEQFDKLDLTPFEGRV
ncbi:MAG: phosphomannomutase/phosphoglucomutase [Ruminococcus sp.]|nr:phosphomannomutase/phosphoglucomutase [Ruminococcus sp.]